jgi:hypothetical protein
MIPGQISREQATFIFGVLIGLIAGLLACEARRFLL